ncbi:hypothetical protein FAGKG844_20244 [Frankia sp. AgKG'84/4]
MIDMAVIDMAVIDMAVIDMADADAMAGRSASAKHARERRRGDLAGREPRAGRGRVVGERRRIHSRTISRRRGASRTISPPLRKTHSATVPDRSPSPDTVCPSARQPPRPRPDPVHRTRTTAGRRTACDGDAYYD